MTANTIRQFPDNTDPQPPTTPGAALPHPDTWEALRESDHGGRTRDAMLAIRAHRWDARIIDAHRAAQARNEMLHRRAARLQAAHERGQVAAFVRAHPDLFTEAGQRALFVGPVVEDGCAYWLSEEATAA